MWNSAKQIFTSGKSNLRTSKPVKVFAEYVTMKKFYPTTKEEGTKQQWPSSFLLSAKSLYSGRRVRYQISLPFILWAPSRTCCWDEKTGKQFASLQRKQKRWNSTAWPENKIIRCCQKFSLGLKKKHFSFHSKLQHKCHLTVKKNRGKLCFEKAETYLVPLVFHNFKIIYTRLSFVTMPNTKIQKVTKRDNPYRNAKLTPNAYGWQLYVVSPKVMFLGHHSLTKCLNSEYRWSAQTKISACLKIHTYHGIPKPVP